MENDKKEDKKEVINKGCSTCGNYLEDINKVDKCPFGLICTTDNIRKGRFWIPKSKIDKERIIRVLSDISWEAKKVIKKQELVIKQIEKLKNRLKRINGFVKFNDRGEIINDDKTK